MKKFNIGIIPVRMDSTRFPGKPLKKICNIPMLGHIVQRSKMSKTLDDLFVATCDYEIRDYCNSIGAKCIMTSKLHTRASDRTAEAAKKIEKNKKKKVSNIVMIQGDEPLVQPKMIDDTIKYLGKKEVEITNIVAKIDDNENWLNTNTIKVLKDENNNAIYFSRSPIPHMKKFNSNKTFRQICIIGFSKKSLNRFNKLKETDLEKLESIDMNRFIENGIKIKLINTNDKPFPVDTFQDLRRVSRIMKSDKFFLKYRNKYV